MTEILVAEDNPADVYLIREALKEHGVEGGIRVVSDGGDLLRMIGREDSVATDRNFGLIILDLNLPRHDGIEILQRLGQSPAFAQIPVVVLTSSDSPKDRLVANQLGAIRYFRKPSNLEQFLNLGAVFKDLLTHGKRSSQIS
jgi:chemotaxis family two-component system response regulator Rcp1